MITQQQLRELCKPQHDRAETTTLAQQLIAGTISSQHYKQLCYQLYLIADAIEGRYVFLEPDLQRRNQLVLDLASCEGSVSACKSTLTYVEHIASRSTRELRAHIYVHYLGWLYGGQMIAKKLSLPTNHLRFANPKACVDHMRNMILVDLTEDDAHEAIAAFDSIIRIYDEISA